MNWKKTFLCLSAVILIAGACSPSVITINRDQEKASPTQLPEPSPQPEPTIIQGPIDCGEDLECFYGAVESCGESKLAYSQSLNMMGADISTTLVLIVLGQVEDQCQFSVVTDEISVTLSEEAVQQLLDSGKSQEEIESQRLVMEEAQSAAKFDEVCLGQPADLIAMLQRWEAGQLSMSDWDPFSCEGALFSSAEAVPEPTEQPAATEEVQMPEGGNILGNASFESDPESTSPRWMVDTKNTNVVAKWSMDYSKLGQYSLMLSASQSGNQGFPGWFLAEPIPIEQPVWHVYEVWAMSPDGADAFISAQFLDAEGAMIASHSGGCVDLEPDIWTRMTFGILDTSFEGVSSISLGMQQCLLETEGTLTHLYYDQIYFGTTPP